MKKSKKLLSLDDETMTQINRIRESLKEFIFVDLSDSDVITMCVRSYYKSNVLPNIDEVLVGIEEFNRQGQGEV